jgi:hypothetical protein
MAPGAEKISSFIARDCMVSIPNYPDPAGWPSYCKEVHQLQPTKNHWDASNCQEFGRQTATNMRIYKPKNMIIKTSRGDRCNQHLWGTNMEMCDTAGWQSYQKTALFKPHSTTIFGDLHVFTKRALSESRVLQKNHCWPCSESNKSAITWAAPAFFFGNTQMILLAIE